MAKKSKKERRQSAEKGERVSAATPGAFARLLALGPQRLEGLVLFLAVVLVYVPVCWAGYIWDDSAVVTSNPVVVGPLGLREIWTTSAADICPLTLTTFWAEYQLWGLAQLPYHLVNVFMHAASAILLWRVLLALRIPGAWLGAALWALHPVMVESVAWVSEMKNTQSGIFFLLTILFFVKGLNAVAREKSNYALTLLFAFLAITSKTSTVVLPGVLCLCAWWVQGKWDWRVQIKTVPIFFMSLIAGLVSIWTQKQQALNFYDTPDTRNWGQRLATAGDDVWFYLGKLFWPQDLLTVYPRWEIDAGAPGSYLPSLSVVIILAFLWQQRTAWSRGCFFVFAYFVIALFPALGFFDHTYSQFSFVADHFQYLASMGPLAFAAAGIVWIANKIVAAKPWLLSGFATVILLVLGVLTWQQAWIFKDQESLWNHTLARNSTCWVGFNDLGDILLQKGEPDNAIAHYQRALELHPMYAIAENNIGYAYAAKGELDQARQYYLKALDYNSGIAIIHKNLGDVYIQTGKLDDAVDQYEKSRAINPDYAEIHNDLAVAFAKKGDLDKSLAELQEALRLHPGLKSATNNLATVRQMVAQKPPAK